MRVKASNRSIILWRFCQGELNMEKRITERLLKTSTLFVIGGLLYGIIELAWRGHTHISMFWVGGLCFVLIGALDEVKKPVCVFLQLPIAAVIVTAIEFASGLIINLLMGLDVWDYSDMPFNVLGQVCLPFSAMWLGLALPAIIIEDSLRVMLFGEKPKALRFLPKRLIKQKEALP